jgi:hypothetical protein
MGFADQTMLLSQPVLLGRMPSVMLPGLSLWMMLMLCWQAALKRLYAGLG